jgi:hypothetical protein
MNASYMFQGRSYGHEWDGKGQVHSEDPNQHERTRRFIHATHESTQLSDLAPVVPDEHLAFRLFAHRTIALLRRVGDFFSHNPQSGQNCPTAQHPADGRLCKTPASVPVTIHDPKIEVFPEKGRHEDRQA